VSSASEVELIVRDAFEDVALLIGGAASLHQMEDQLVRSLIRRLERIRSRTVGRLARADNGRAARAPQPGLPHGLHPAIERFLLHNACGHSPVKEGGPRAD